MGHLLKLNQIKDAEDTERPLILIFRSFESDMYNCEHNRDSMFAVEPCEFCKTLLENRQGYTLSEKIKTAFQRSESKKKKHSNEDNKHFHLRVRWVDDTDEPLEKYSDEEDGSPRTRRKGRPKPILKHVNHRFHNVVIITAE